METIDKIVKSSIAPKRTDVVWFNTTDKSQYIFTPDGKWTKVSGGGDSTDGIQQVTYLELKKLRNQGKLVPGKQYRITDYTCAVSNRDYEETNDNIQSAGNQFDIIVTADTESTLNENARACNHIFNIEGKYFVGEYNGELYIFVHMPELYSSSSPSSDHLVIGDDVPIPLHSYSWVHAGKFTDISDIDWKYIFKDPHYVYTEGDVKVGDIITDGGANLKVVQIGTVTVPSKMYDYFSDSNLSAWEIKYSLDGDFSWRSEEIGKSAFIGQYSNEDTYVWTRYESLDKENKYAWAECGQVGATTFDGAVVNWNNVNPMVLIYTESPILSIGDTIVQVNEKTGKEIDIIVTDFCSDTSTIFAPESGTGVIYYMKDEFGNECPYDFKNIMFYYFRQWQYTFVGSFREDGSLSGNYRQNVISMRPDKKLPYLVFTTDISNYPACLNEEYSVEDSSEVIDGTHKLYYISDASAISFVTPPTYVTYSSSDLKNIRKITILYRNTASISVSLNGCTVVGDGSPITDIPANNVTVIEATWDSTASTWIVTYTRNIDPIKAV